MFREGHTRRNLLNTLQEVNLNAEVVEIDARDP